MTNQNNQNKNQQPSNPGKNIDQNRDKQRPDDANQGRADRTKE